MKYAIVQSGSRQFHAEEGRMIEVEKLVGAVGDEVELEDVLLVADGEDVKVGRPTVPGAKVTASIAGQVKGEKLIVFKYKPKQRYRRKTGHRQQYTRLKIEKITAGK